MILKEDRIGRATRAPRPTYSRFVFTVFFGDASEQAFCFEKLTSLNSVLPFQYVVVGMELSPVTQRLHLQGYFELNEAVRPRAVMRLLPGFHVEPAVENREANYRYCTKSKVYVISEVPISSIEMGVWGSVTPPSLTESKGSVIPAMYDADDDCEDDSSWYKDGYEIPWEDSEDNPDNYPDMIDFNNEMQ